MANQPHQFKHRDAVRCLKAASAAGVRDPMVRIRLPNGTELVVGGAGGKTDVASSAVLRPGMVRQRTSSRSSRPGR
jgi:hypothetical protein